MIIQRIYIQMCQGTYYIEDAPTVNLAAEIFRLVDLSRRLFSSTNVGTVSGRDIVLFSDPQIRGSAETAQVYVSPPCADLSLITL